MEAFDHAQWFIEFIQSYNQPEALLNAKKLASNYFHLLLREPSPSRETLRRLDLDIRLRNNQKISNGNNFNIELGILDYSDLVKKE